MGERLFRLDPTSDTPLYAQLRVALEDAVLNGGFAPGEALPSSRRLAEDLGISRNTVNAALQDLMAEGFIEAQPRRGLFVSQEVQQTLTETRPDRPGRYDWSGRLGPATRPSLEEIRKNPAWWRYPYPFLSGQPDIGIFPTSGWARALRASMSDDNLTQVLQDAQWRDDELLVELVCRDILPQRGVRAAPENVLITLGSQHALHLVSSVLVRANARVAVEDPGYVDARNIFLLAGGQPLPFAVDASGMRPSAELAAADLVYVTPSHQYPTNVTLSIARRTRLLDLAARRGTIVIEDDYDSEFRYRGTPTVAFKALDEADQVVYLGSFSKFVAPGLRLGFVVGAPELIEELRLRSRYSVRHPSGQMQRALALFIQSGQYARHVRRVKKHFKRKWEVCVDAASTHFTWREHTFPPGGMSLWVHGPDDVDAADLAVAAEGDGVLIEPGTVCFLRRPAPRNRFRLGFAAIDIDAIEPGVRALAQVVERVRPRHRSATRGGAKSASGTARGRRDA